MYNECHLVHADLSEYNMLWHRGEVVFIDVGQSVEPSHPYGLEFLFRDCLNVSRFFSQRWPSGKAGVMGAQELFNYVTGMGLSASSDEEFRVQVGVVFIRCCGWVGPPCNFCENTGFHYTNPLPKCWHPGPCTQVQVTHSSISVFSSLC